LRRHLSYANVTASLALFVALGGTGYAAVRVPRNGVGPAQIRRNAVTSSELRAGAVGASEIRSGAVGRSEIRTNGVGSSEIRRDGVGSSEIRRAAVSSDEIRNGRIAGVDLEAGAIDSPQLKDGGVDPIDLSSDTRALFQVATVRAAVNSAGDLVAGNAKSATKAGADVTVTFDRDVSDCFYAATPVKVGDDTPAPGATISAASGAPDSPDDVVVTTSGPFHLIVDC
jgi:hypothetical protein